MPAPYVVSIPKSIKSILKLRIPFVLWFSCTAIASILIAPALLNAGINSDMVWQRFLGAQILETHRIPTHLGTETLSAPGAPWVPQEWLLGLALALAQRAHTYVLLVAASIFAVIATMFLGAARTRRRVAAQPLFLALCVILIGLSTLESFGVRAQVFAWPLFALLLLLLDDGSAVVWWCLPLTALWSNLHASVVLAPVMAFLYAVGALIDEHAWTPRAIRYFLLVPLLLLSACVNPFGWHLPFYAIALQHSPVRAFITEWQPTGIRDYTLWLSIVPICLGVALLYWRKRCAFASADVMVVLACAYLSLSASRNIPIFSIAVAPIVCAGLAEAFPLGDSSREHPIERALQGLVALVVLPAICWFSFHHSTISYLREGMLLPTDAINFIGESRGQKRLFCYDFAHCSLALGRPGFRTFMDGRCDPFPWPVWERYRTVIQVRRGWERVLDDYRITHVLTKDAAQLTRSIGASGHWKRIYHQNGYSVFAHAKFRNDSSRHVGLPPLTVGISLKNS
ncbi:MAG: hypothetical protein M3160_02380 [Candidatus Eremiobacteraeota bacterium]|nr:hypothetical protein [Candidatus Eremiobacteraeota bacterium]